MIDFDRLNFDPGNMNKNFVLSLKLVKLQILVAKSSKALPTFPVRNTNIVLEKLVNFAGLYIFRILQHFATEFCSFTNFRMLFLFLAVMKDFVLIAYICQL